MDFFKYYGALVERLQKKILEKKIIICIRQ